ncbi:LysR family transcriptional regulator [Actinophytocola oryzae]|uniref:DNA-binding transcriptional LysR family regulator n=1 Tax=Actinophytocola oryzae TaxID=502181 RepID=A0A4R7VYH3_9PSEU|nr:LysR family transcriptional regulator [Actinophytocola oryzae]TDV55230.1 DNA-binding transcriptional LysR family regulator [Actinophytocola oryzae]
MEIRQLRYLVTIVEAGGFTRAAERVHVAQPGVSAQIRLLERELGQELLDRSGRGVSLTDAGAAVLPFARAALRAIDDLREVADELAGLMRGHVRLGMVTSCGVPDMPLLLERFHRDYPGIDITLVEDDSHALVDQLRDGTLDVALIALTRKDPEGLTLSVIADEAVVAAVGYGEPLSDRESVGLGALEEHTLISMPVGSGMRDVLDEACTAAGVRPRIGLEATNPSMLARLAARGLGVAIVPESTADEHTETVHKVRIVRPSLRGRLAMAWRTEGQRSTAARALVELAGGVPT